LHAEDFGSQSNVSEVLGGKREINARQARVLAGCLDAPARPVGDSRG
jgi:antitoxin component HigA of HigAB toxin-antitoxin module